MYIRWKDIGAVRTMVAIPRYKNAVLEDMRYDALNDVIDLVFFYGHCEYAGLSYFLVVTLGHSLGYHISFVGAFNILSLNGVKVNLEELARSKL